MDAAHVLHLRQALQLAASARARGDHPFGALLFDPVAGTVVATGMNSVLTERDCTGHVRMNVLTSCGVYARFVVIE